MLLLALDPASERTGFAVLSDPVTILDAGRITAPAKWPAEQRIDQIITDLAALLAERKPDTIVIEMPDGKIHGAIRRRSGGAGLSIYGRAAGEIRRYCLIWAAHRDPSPPVVSVYPNEWTRSKSKTSRAAGLRAYMPGLDLTSDTGLDAADAIELAQWYLRETRLRKP